MQTEQNAPWRGKEYAHTNVIILFEQMSLGDSVTRKKSPYVYKSWQNMISLEKWLILTPLQKLPKNVWDLGKLIVAKGFKKFPEVQ